jgi:two-component system response regulator HydG
MRGRILFISEFIEDFHGLPPELENRGFLTLWTQSADKAVAFVEDGDAEVVVAHATWNAGRTAEFCAQISDSCPNARVILISDSESSEQVLGALRAGAFDYFCLPVDVDAMELALHRALRQQELREEVSRMRTALSEGAGFEELVGVSQPMHQLYDLLERAASTTSSVVITGESGTGKELIARALHQRSVRAAGPFVALNCSAIPESLVESELFGHAKGAYTDAKVARVGLFVQANGGTIFLDEVGDLPLSMQPKLLRALQERCVRPVGGNQEIPFDARIISATNDNLELAATEKRFREDLFYRLNVIHLHIPPLRDRASDVLLIAQHYLEHYAIHLEKQVQGLSAAVSDRLLAYPWPGNVRELQNCIERAVALTRNEQLQVQDLPEKIRAYKRSHILVVGDHASDLVSMNEVESRYILRVMQAVGGNKREAARILGFDRKTLYRKLDRYHLDIPKQPPSKVKA